MVQTIIEDDCDQLAYTLELFTEYETVLEMLDNLPKSLESGFEKKYEVYSEVLSRYQYQPHLLDPHLGTLIQKTLQFVTPTGSQGTDPLSHAAFKYLYQIVKVRNYKILVNFLPHELTDLEFVLTALEKQDLNDSDNWETRYVLLLWMSILVLNPFHLSRLDALSPAAVDGSGGGGGGATKMERIFLLCKQNTDNNDPCSSVAAYMTAKYMSRIDVSEKFLHKFFEGVMREHGAESAQEIKVGQLAAIAQILKHGKRESLLKEASALLQWIVSCDFKGNSDYLKYKFCMKIVQRLGMVFLKPRLARWRYQRGSRSLATNLSSSSAQPEADKKAEQLLSMDIREDTEEDIEVVDEIEEIIEELLQGLRSASSMVRWNSAKGIGRITNRLPKTLGDEVVGTVIDMLSPVEQHEAWHGACLAIAELAKRGLLLPYRLEAMVPLLLQALVYDELKGCMSVGQHIRDAACYMSWAFARAYNPQDLAPFVDRIASGLLITTVFDREINCRRAASAAFQESVGRLGNFPHGIDILTVADFFTVGVRTNSFLEISEFISQFEEYKLPLIDHLLQKKINHWDVTIRELAAKALNRLTKRSPAHMANAVMQKLFELTDSIDVNTRHGSIVALGEVALALKEQERVDNQTYLLAETDLQLNQLIGKFLARDQFRGMSGEIMKQGCSDFIQNCSRAGVQSSDECLATWQSFIEKCLVNKNAQIREAATKAFHEMCVAYYVKDLDGQRNLQIIESYLEGCRNDLEEHIRMGYLMAVGAFPKLFFELRLNEIVQTLIAQCQIPNPAQNPNENIQTRTWSEARRDSVKALTSVMMKMELDKEGKVVTEGVRKCVAEAFECFLRGLDEYTSDNRGDIGAWVREASMKGLYQLVTVCPKELLAEELVLKIMRGLAQQAVEKIDRTRGLAGKLFCALVHHRERGEIPHIKRHAELKAIFPEDPETVLWLFADNTFPLFCAMLAFEEYSDAVLLGLTSSIGQLSESLIKYSSSSLFNFMKSHPEHVQRLGNEILGVFQAHLGIDRITSPMLNFIDLLIRSGSVNSLICSDENESCAFGEEVFRLVNAEIKGHKKLYKLVSAVNVLCQLIQVKSLVTKIFSKVSVFLGLPLVHVRKTTATKFYEALILYGDQTDIPEENLDEVFNLLTDTDWGQPLEQVRPIRNELCRLIGIKPPIAANSSAGN